MLILVASHVCYNILGILEEITAEELEDARIVFWDPGCDKNTRKYAKWIQEENPGSILLQSKTARAICDNNRMVCRNTPMRKKLRKLLEEYGEDAIVIDIHSYPSGKSWKLLWDPETVLLDIYQSEETMKLFGMFREGGDGADVEDGSVDSVAIIGSTVNDIQLETRQYGGKAVLLELWDKLGEDDVRKIGKIISKWVKELEEPKEDIETEKEE